MHTSQRISKFYEDLEKLELRFPGKELAALGYSKGYVSDVINKKKEPSEELIKDFYKKFSNSSQSNNPIDQPLPLGDLRITLKDYFDLLIEQKRKAEEREKEYLDLIKNKLISIDTNSKELVDDVAALTSEIQAENRAMMDSIDVAAKQPIGTTRAAAGIVEIASEKERHKMGKQTNVGRQS